MRKLSITAAAIAISLWVAGCGQDNNADQGATGTDRASADRSAGTSSSRDDTSVTNSTAPDNTGINKRDQNDEALTPGDQGTSQEDREITRRIRRAITQNDQMSTAAKNVKIITVNAKVTLRGPVNSEAERDQIAAVAQQIAGSGLDNQLEVKQTTSTTEERK